MPPLETGTWVELPDGSVARILEIDQVNGVVLAATPDGHPIDRPLPFAEARWVPLAESDLRVQRLLDPDGIVRLVTEDPVALVAAVISGRGGTASVADIRGVLTPKPIETAAFEAWWKNVQRKLASDPRIDASYARDRTYRLASSLGDRSTPPGDPVSTETRNGRHLADARLLMRARALVAESRGVPPESRTFVEQEASLFRRLSVDPTDRLLSFDLAVRAGMASAADVATQLGADVLLVDLTRIRDKATREQALRWAAAFVEAQPADGRRTAAPPRAPLLASAGTLGDELEPPALELARLLALPREVVFGGRLGWAVPGSEEAGKPKYPDDLEVFAKRLARWESSVIGAGTDELRATAAGAVDALNVLHDSATHHHAWLRLMDRLAAFTWRSGTAADTVVLLRTRVPDLRPVAAEAIVRLATRANLGQLRPLVLDWFKADPKAYRNALLDFAQRAETDPVGLVLQIARAEIASTAAPSLAGTAFDMAMSTGRTDQLVVESANLAGTIAADHPGVADALEARAGGLIAALLAEQPDTSGSAWFSAKDWRALAEGVLKSLRTARAEAAQARGAETELRAEIARLQQALQLREQALASSRTGQISEDRNTSQRVAANSLRPVVKALADSYESNSLAALQDALAAILGRARIEPIGTRGDTVEFDPRRHRWVGEGSAADEGLVISPGFALREEGAEDVVLVAARVVATGGPGAAG